MVEENIIHYKSVSFSHVVQGTKGVFFCLGVAKLVVNVGSFGSKLIGFFCMLVLHQQTVNWRFVKGHTVLSFGIGENQ